MQKGTNVIVRSSPSGCWHGELVSIDGSTVTLKVASIVGHACMCSDDGRAITYEWQLYLNDHGGAGNWHGGPAFPNHCSRFDTEEAARTEAKKHGYTVIGTHWG